MQKSQKIINPKFGKAGTSELEERGYAFKETQGFSNVLEMFVCLF